MATRTPAAASLLASMATASRPLAPKVSSAVSTALKSSWPAVPFILAGAYAFALVRTGCGIVSRFRSRKAAFKEHSSPASSSSSLLPATAADVAPEDGELAAVHGPPEAAAAAAAAPAKTAAPPTPVCTEEHEQQQQQQQVKEEAAIVPAAQPEGCKDEPLLPPCTPPRMEKGSSSRLRGTHTAALAMAASQLYAAQREPVVKPAGADMDLPACIVELVPSRSGRHVCRVQHFGVSRATSSSAFERTITVYQPAVPM